MVVLGFDLWLTHPKVSLPMGELLEDLLRILLRK
jgi:hypothetical protein